MTMPKKKITDDDVLKVVIGDLQKQVQEATDQKYQLEKTLCVERADHDKFKENVVKEFEGLKMNFEDKYCKVENEWKQTVEEKNKAWSEIDQLRIAIDVAKNIRDSHIKQIKDLEHSITVQRNEMCESSNKAISKYKTDLEFAQGQVRTQEIKIKDLYGQRDESARLAAHYKDQVAAGITYYGELQTKMKRRAVMVAVFFLTLGLLAGYILQAFIRH